MKKICITSGGTREYIDDVRVMTNISSGKLGAEIAEIFADANFGDWGEIKSGHQKRDKNQKYDIYYLHTKTAVMPTGKATWAYHTLAAIYENSNSTIQNFEVNSVNDVHDAMEQLVPDMDVVIHCMAVSDFTFDRANPVKLKSNDAQGFIDYMRDNIVTAPKIIPKIKKWNPDVFLVGFKFEVGLSEKELISIACDSKKVYNGDLVIANDKKQMVNAGEHIAYVCKSKRKWYKVAGKPEIAKAILTEVQGI